MKASYAKLVPVTAAVIGILGVSIAGAQQGTTTNGDLKWANAPASLPAGARVALVQGDLAKAGPLTFRLKLPAGYKLMPHSSPAIDRIVVVSGTFNLGSGEKFDNARTIPMSTGYVHWPEKSPYFAFAGEETVIEYQGVGPWTVRYVSPADDPARKNK